MPIAMHGAAQPGGDGVAGGAQPHVAVGAGAAAGSRRSSTSRAVVIGSGFGGLAAAVRLAVRGYRVTVLEALDQPGGRARVFRRGGYTFDVGPTVITAPYLLEELFALVGRDMADYVELMPVDPFYRILFPDGATFDYVGDEDLRAREEGEGARVERGGPRNLGQQRRADPEHREPAERRRRDRV